MKKKKSQLHSAEVSNEENETLVIKEGSVKKVSSKTSSGQKSK